MDGIDYPGELTTFDPGRGRKLSETTKTVVLNVLYNNLQKTIIDCVSRGTSLLISVSDEAAKVESLPGKAIVSISGDLQVVNLSKDVQNILTNEDVYLKTSDQSAKEMEEGVEFRKEIVLEPLNQTLDNGVWNCLCTHCKTLFSRLCPVFEEEERKRKVEEKKAKQRARRKKQRPFNPRRIRVKCEYCGKIVTNQSLKLHMEAHEGKRYPCHSCTKTFKSPYSRTRHEKIHFYGHHKTVRCPHCPKRFYTTGAFNIHLNTKHKKMKRHFCTDCGKGYYFLNQLKHHVKSHTGEPFVCKVCSKGFLNKFRLRVHNKREHNTKKVIREKKHKSKKKH